MKFLILVLLAVLSLKASISDAQVLYDKGEYQKALEELKGSTDEYGNKELHLLWAQTALKLDRYEEAMSAYERVLIIDPDDQIAKEGLYRVYKNTHRDTLAHKIEKGSVQQSRGEFQLNAMVSGGYDTNINFSATGSSLDSYYGFNTSLDEISTLFTRVNANGVYTYDVGERGGCYLSGELNLYYQNNADAHYYDMLIAGGAIVFGYEGERYSFYLPLNYAQVNYLDMDMYSVYSLQPSVRYNITKALISQVDLKYLARKYDALYKRMDDASLGFGAKFYYLIDQDAAYLSFEYEDFSAKNSSPISYIEKTFYTLNAGYIYTFSQNISVELQYKFRAGEYADSVGISSSEKRSDKYNQAELNLSYGLNKNFHLFASQRYVKNLSNFVPARYTKSISMFGLDIRY